MHVLKYYLRRLGVPWNTWLIRRYFAFIKSDCCLSAFNKTQRWSVTHRLQTAFAGCRGRDFSGGTGWSCSQIGNRRPETKAGRGTGKGEEEQEINADLMLSEGLMAPWGAPERLLRPRSREQGCWAPRRHRFVPCQPALCAPGCSSCLLSGAPRLRRCPVI